MRTFLLSLATCFMLIPAMAQSPHGFLVKGSVRGLAGSGFYYMYCDPVSNTNVVDSMNIHADDFEIRGVLSSGEPVMMAVQRIKRDTLLQEYPLRFYIRNGDTTHISGACPGFDLALCTGSPFNEQLNELKTMENGDKYALMRLSAEASRKGGSFPGFSDSAKQILDRLTNKHIAFVKEHPGSYVSAMLLALDLGNRFNAKEISVLYEQLDPQVKESPYGKMVRRRLEPAEQKEENMPAISFEQKDIYGNTVRLSDFRGKYVLLDFWGSWCGPCRAGNPHLKKMYEQYRDSGLVVIGIANEYKPATEERRKACLAAVAEDGLPWIQLLNEDGGEPSNITAAYKVTGLPTKILIGKDGKVIGRYIGTDLNAPDPLEKKLKEVFL